MSNLMYNKKQFLTALLIVVILFIEIGFPLQASAIPVEDFITEVATYAQQIKDYFLDFAARIIAGTIIRGLTMQVVGWIQNTDVGFVSNLDAAFRQTSDEAAGRLLNNITGLNLCGNIGAFLRINIRTPSLLRFECTLSQIVQNVENFYRNFENGGWETLISISVQPQNNVYGAFLMTLDAQISAENAARQRVSKNADWGDGFMGIKVPKQTNCEVLPKIESRAQIEQAKGEAIQKLQAKGKIDKIETEGHQLRAIAIEGGEQIEAPTKICATEYETKTPGQVVSSQLQKSLGVDYDFAVVADEINEALGTIANALISRLITESFSALNSATGVGPQTGEGLFAPSLAQPPPFRPQEIPGITVFQDITKGIADADATLLALNEKLIITQNELFSVRKQIEDLNLRLKSALPEEIPTLSQELATLQTSASSLAAAGQKTLDGIIRVLNAQENLISMQEAVSGEEDALLFANTVTRIPTFLNTIFSAAQENAVAISAAIISGDAALDNLLLLTNASSSVASNIRVIENTIKEIDRVLLSPKTTCTVSGSSVSCVTGETQRETNLRIQRPILDAQKTILASDLTKIGSLVNRWNLAPDGTVRQTLISETVNLELLINRDLSQSITTIKSTEILLAP